MSEVLSNTGAKLWSETDYNELWLTVFDQLTGQGGKSNIRLVDEAIGKINDALDGYKFEFSSDEDRLYISKGDSKLPVSLIDSNGHVASKVDGTTIIIDENGIVKGIPVDDALSEESTNPLQNKVIAGELKSIKSKMGTDESAIKQNTSDITSNTKRIEANETAISTLNGTGDGSVKKAVSDGIAEVVAGAPEDFDTLKEMSDWINSHESSASAMNSQIQDNKKAITTLQTDKADKTEIPIVPTNVSEFTNDAGYLTEHQDISNLVAKEEGKGLSSNDYTSEEKTKLGGVGTSQGRNLISYPYTAKEGTGNGITWTVNDDGTITADGTATNNSFFNLTNYIVGKWDTLHAGTYTIMDGVNLPIGGVTLQVESTTGTQYKNKTFTIEQDVVYKIFIYIPSGTVANNITFKPMLEIGSIAHMYESTTISNTTLGKKLDNFKQYKPDGTTITADEDGTLHGVSKIDVDDALSDESTNPVQNKVVNKALEGRANGIAFDESTNKLSLKSGETVLKEVEAIQKGYYVGPNPPKNTDILWIDSSHGGITKYYSHSTVKWHPVRAKGYDSPVDLLREQYWDVFPNYQSIAIDGLSAIYDVNTGKITFIIKTLNVSSKSTFGPSEMVNIIMTEFNVGNTGTIAAVSSNGPHDLEMKLSYPCGYIQLKGGAPFAQYAPTTYSNIKFEFTYH